MAIVKCPGYNGTTSFHKAQHIASRTGDRTHAVVRSSRHNESSIAVYRYICQNRCSRIFTIQDRYIESTDGDITRSINCCIFNRGGTFIEGCSGKMAILPGDRAKLRTVICGRRFRPGNYIRTKSGSRINGNVGWTRGNNRWCQIDKIDG